MPTRLYLIIMPSMIGCYVERHRLISDHHISILLEVAAAACIRALVLGSSVVPSLLLVVYDDWDDD